MKLNFEFTKEDITKIKADILIIACKMKDGDEKRPGELSKNDGGVLLDKKLGGLISGIISEEEFHGKVATHRIVQTHDRIGAKKIVIIGIGKAGEFNLDTIRKVGAKAGLIANKLKAKTIAGIAQAEKINKMPSADRLQAFAEGMILGNYHFAGFKNIKDIEKPTLEKVNLVYNGNSAPISKAITLGSKIAAAVNYAKDLTNTPGDRMTPDRLAQEARKIGKENGITVKVLDEKGIKRENMNLITAVGEGASNPPRFIHLKYTPAKKAKTKIALVGKGITFDSGGYNLKPGRHMEDMKSDMAGAATVLAVMKLLPFIKPKVSVDAYIPATENMIDGKAHKPGDVIKSRSGKTVEIINTDAEGRLILADAFDYAAGNKCDILIDLATLTGHVLYGLGEIYTAILGNDQKLVDNLIAASREAGEPTWQLPLETEYLKGLKEGIADLNNNGKSSAGTIVAALFLHEFVGKTKWAHFDIAESAWMKEERDYRQKGATGAGIQTLVKFLMSY